jgi:hypothetical protein
MADVYFSGASAWNAAIDGVTADVEAATRSAVAEGAAVIQRQAKQNASGRPGPRVISGALRGGIVVDGPRPDGLGAFVARILSTVRYARAIEEGHPRWKTGNKFPYLGPAFDFARSVALPVIFERAWAAALKRRG